ncbi:hypothetical protein GTW43_16420 [Streptomyces sp. SID5785]|uniref:nuclear transport factor 2 family protein n=1 Tax=Streptomyces sp. SID5785 TaxID=2690309 RepID=UPI001360FF6D|nr:hypothetical protein [Streptomyces sp. SID5785]MZD06670.1 hypothetical protein [Streptomyces sp. SID5785]
MDRIGRPLLLAALALTLVAAAFAAWGGWSWYGAAHDDTASYATARDNALEAGEQAVQNLNTLDHKKLADGLDLWETSTTGALHTQLVDGRSAFEKQVREAKTVSTAKVLDGALTELDARAGKARVLVALRVTVTASGGKSSEKDSRMLGELTRTDGHWKLSALGQAPVGDTATTD